MVFDRSSSALGERGPIPDLRQQFNVVMWRFRTGSPWRDLPVEYGPWSTVYDRFRSWATAGVFEELMQAMIAEAAARGQAGFDLVRVDSTTVRAHHHAAGMVMDPEVLERQRGQNPPDGEPGDDGKRNGERRRLRPAAPHPADGSRAGPLSGWADRQDPPVGRKNRGSHGGRPVSHDPELYEQRNTAERRINQIKEWRRVGLPLRQDPTNPLPMSQDNAITSKNRPFPTTGSQSRARSSATSPARIQMLPNVTERAVAAQAP
ncbi:transposase [Nonomuraea sp. NPDC050790]|uniref:transposase n=1 Tax=Nonomuraea sp. NPDC050790 TaxID=3364371 RepID=UPI0037935C24